MGVIILVAIITVAIVVVLFVVSGRLNRRNPELEDSPRRPDGAEDVWGGPGAPSGD